MRNRKATPSFCSWIVTLSGWGGYLVLVREIPRGTKSTRVLSRRHTHQHLPFVPAVLLCEPFRLGTNGLPLEGAGTWL